MPQTAHSPQHSASAPALALTIAGSEATGGAGAQAEGRHRSLSVARDALGASASALDPHQLGGGSVHGEALVMLLRPMMVDLLEATGAPHDEARAYLPRV